MNYLDYNYGKIRSEEVSAKEAEVMAMTWQPHDPLVLLTLPIENLKKLAVKANVPYSEKQLLEKALTIIRNTRDFEYALTLWENKPENEKTWSEFKNYFHEAQLNLKKIRGPTMQQAGYHHANHLANRITSDIQEQLNQRDSQVLAMLQSIPSLASSTESNSDDQPTSHYVNQTIHRQSAADQTQLEILKLLKEISMEMKKTPAVPRQNRYPRKTPNRKMDPPRAQTDKYCWTHGASNHTGKECKRRAQGHKPDATFNDKKGGSTAYCT